MSEPPRPADTAVLPAVGPATQSSDTQLLRAGSLRDDGPDGPGDDPDDGPTSAPDGGRHRDRDDAPPARRRRLLVPLVALLAVGAIGFGVVQGLGSDGATPAASAPPASTTSAAPTTATPRLLLASANYVGRPVDEVRAELSVFGLAVTLRPLTTTDVPDGAVIAVDPVGELAPGSPVTLTHAVAPPPAPAPTPEPAPAPAPVPAPETVVVTAVPEEDGGDGNRQDDPDDEDDDDRGNGRGNGRGRGND